MAPTPLVITWGIGPFVGIVVGGAVGLVLIVVLPILLVQHRRNARARKLEGGADQELNTIQMTNSKHQGIPRISIIPAEAATAGYDTLPSKENLRGEYQQDEKRKRESDLLSWPLPGRRSSKRNTRSGATKQAPDPPNAEPRTQNDLLDPRRASAGTPRGLSYSANMNRPGSPQQQKSPSAALKPLPLFSSRTSALTSPGGRPGLERSCSVPSVLNTAIEATPTTKSGQEVKRESRVRSFSLGSLTAQKSSETLPPLPALPKTVAADAARKRRKHRSASSTASLSSVDTTTSSILKQANSPPIGASVGFVHRNPDVGLGLQIHDRDSSDFKLKLLVAAQLVGAARIAERNTRPDESLNRVSVGEVHTAESIRLHRISASPAPSTIRAVSTPHRDSHMRKASWCGSPEERQQIAVFREVSGNSGMPSRDISQASFMTFDSVSTNNPFQYSPTPPTHRPQPPPLKSALKHRSPGGSQKTTRNNSGVRVLSNPTKYWFPEFTRSPSMSDIREDIHEDESEVMDFPSPSPEDEDLDDHFDIANEPPSPILERQGKPTALRATLNTTSSALYMNRFEQEPSSSNRGSRVRESVASSIVSLSAFPIPGGAFAGQNWRQMPQITTSGSVIESSPPQPVPDSPTIPGLTLLSQSSSQSQETFPFPTIEIDPSTLNFDPPAAEVLDGPGPTVLATPPRPALHRKNSSKSNGNSKDRSATARSSTHQSSSVNPLESIPDFAESVNGTLAPPNRLSGPRAAPAKSTVALVTSLRRENSDVKQLYDSDKGVRRYARMGRQPSPNLSNNDLWAMPEGRQREAVEGDLGISGISVWEDGENAWQDSPKSAPKSMDTTSSKTPTSVKRRAGFGNMGRWEDQENMIVDVPGLMEVPLHGY